MTTYQIITLKNAHNPSILFQNTSTHSSILTFTLRFPHDMWRNKITDKDRKWKNKLKDLFSFVFLHFPIITAEKIGVFAQHWNHWHRLTATSQSWFSSLETMRSVGRLSVTVVSEKPTASMLNLHHFKNMGIFIKRTVGISQIELSVY
jgi:hypothetical protein